MSNDAVTDPLTSLPVVDLDALKHPHYLQWGWGGSQACGWVEASHRVTAYDGPDANGFTAYLGSRGVTREELPEVAAFLLAVYAASSPEALAARYPCDCDRCDCTDPDCDLEHGGHASYCTSREHPAVAS